MSEAEKQMSNVDTLERFIVRCASGVGNARFDASVLE